MKITKEDLINHGVDPSLYNSDDMAVIERNADRIKNGELDDILEALALPSPDENKFKNAVNKARESVLDYIRELSSQLAVIHTLCASHQSVFSASLTPEETDKILVGSMNAFKKMFELRNTAMDYVTAMFNYKRELANVQDFYNKKLYNAGMLNAAFAVVCPDGNNDGIINAISGAFDLFNSLTEFINDVNDRIVIFDEALNVKLSYYWNEMTLLLDFDGDGASIDTQKTKISAETAMQMLRDVIER